MALFDGDMVTVTTPDGRQVQMPAGLAASFPQLQPVPTAPPPGVTPPADPSAPQPEPLLPFQQAQVTAAANTPPTDAPITRPAQAQLEAPPVPSQPRGPVLSPGEATDPGPANPPQQPRPMTNDQLAKMGNAGVYNQAQQGIEQERSAVQREGAALADQATQVGNKMAAVEAEAGRQLEERRAVAEANAKAMQAKTDEYLRRAQQIADTKIDRSIDHPVITAIGMMLTTLGASMAGRDPSIAVQGFYQAIDRKVAAQMQDLDRQRQGLEVQKEGLGLQRQVNMDRLAEMDQYRLGYLEQAKRQIATIQQKTQSPIILAQTEKASAMITQKQNEVLGGAVAREQQKRETEAARAQQMKMHRESLAVQTRGQSMEQERFLLQLAEKRQEQADLLAEKMMERGDKAAAEKAKKVGELGIMDPRTGDPMLNPAGQRKMAQADALEAQARKAATPEQAQKVAAQAQALRESAMVNDAALATDKKAGEQAQATVKATQDLADNIDDAKKLFAMDPAAWERADYAKIKIALENIKINYATTIGERLSVRAIEALQHVLSFDPDSWFSRTVDKGKVVAAMGILESELTQKADTALKSAGVKSDWRPGRSQPATEFTGQTADEVGRGAEPGIVKKYLVNPIVHPVDTARDKDYVGEATDAANRRTNPKGQASVYGLDPGDDDKVRGLIKRASSAGDAEYGRLVSQLASPLIAKAEDRPSLVRGIVNLVKDEDPKMFADLMAKVESSGGKGAADRVAALVQRPVEGKPTSTSASTPGALQESEAGRVRAKLGLPPPPVQMPPMAPPPAARLPPFFAQLPPESQQAYLNYLRANGIDAGGTQ